MKRLLAIAITVALVFPTVAAATTKNTTGPATEALQKPIDAGIALLRDPQYQTPDKKTIQRDKIWDIIKPAFDFRVISIRSLGRNWRQFSDAEKAEFTEVFAKLLGNTYIGKIQGEYHDETVRFLGEEKLSEDKVIVNTEIVRKTGKIPVDYAMYHEKNGTWRVYDVKVEGIGLVLNYRRQFDDYLATPGNTPAKLIAQLKEKVKAQ